MVKYSYLLSAYQVLFIVFQMLKILSLIFTTVLKVRGHWVHFEDKKSVAQGWYPTCNG